MWLAFGPAGKVYGGFWDVVLGVSLFFVWPASTVVLFGHMVKQRAKIMRGESKKRQA